MRPPSKWHRVSPVHGDAPVHRHAPPPVHGDAPKQDRRIKKIETTTPASLPVAQKEADVVVSLEVEKLKEIGFDASTASTLASRFPADRIREVVAASRGKDNPPGFVVDALNGKWTIPAPKPSRKQNAASGPTVKPMTVVESQKLYKERREALDKEAERLREEWKAEKLSASVPAPTERGDIPKITPIADPREAIARLRAMERMNND